MKKSLSKARFFLVPIHFIIPHILRILIFILGYFFYFLFIQDFISHIKNVDNVVLFLFRDGGYGFFPLTLVGIGLVALFIVIKNTGEKVSIWLHSKKAFWITFYISCFSLILTIATVNYEIVGIPWWLDLILCTYIMLAYGIGGSSHNQIKTEDYNKRMVENKHEDAFEIFKKDLEKKEKEIKHKEATEKL